MHTVVSVEHGNEVYTNEDGIKTIYLGGIQKYFTSKHQVIVTIPSRTYKCTVLLCVGCRSLAQVKSTLAHYIGRSVYAVEIALYCQQANRKYIVTFDAYTIPPQYLTEKFTFQWCHLFSNYTEDDSPARSILKSRYGFKHFLTLKEAKQNPIRLAYSLCS